MAVHVGRRYGIFLLITLLSSLLALPSAQPSDIKGSSNGQQIGTIMSVRQQKHIGIYPFTRYPSIAQFTIDLAIRTPDQAYCTEYETPVLEEVMALLDSKNKDVTLEVRDKKMTLVLPSGRRIHTRLVKATQC